jgi:hypothetical protein
MLIEFFIILYSTLTIMEEGTGKRSRTSLSGFRGSKRVDERHIEFRSDGVPIGDNASKFVNYYAILVRDRVPCTIQSWKNVNVELKNELWNEIKVSPKSYTSYYYIYALIYLFISGMVEHKGR